MARLAQQAARQNKPATAPEKTGLARKAPAQRPAYLQAKLAVSQPGDADERQADQVASEVSRAPRAGLQRASLEPAITPAKKDESLAPKLAARPVPSAARIARTTNMATDEATTLQPGLQRQEKHEEAAGLQRADDDTEPAAADPGGPTVAAPTEARIAALQGQGEALPESVRQDMETQFGRDLAAVYIHVDSSAAELCAEVGARAFTVGSDIFFAPGEYAPETEAGRELLAHEMTHVVQQGGGSSGATTAARLHRKAKADGGEGTYERGSGYIAFDRITIPGNYANAYDAKKPLIRHRAFSADTRTTTQQRTWRDNIDIAQSQQKLNEVIAAHPNAASAAPQTCVFKVPSPHQDISGASPRFVIGNLETCARELSIPSWNTQGRPVPASRGSRITSFDVDHVVEAQLGAASESGRQFAMREELDAIDNFQLLTDTANTEKMNAIKRGVRDRLGVFIAENNEQYRNKAFSEWNEEALLGHLSVKFDAVDAGGNLATPADARWERQGDNGVESGKHLQSLIDAEQIRFMTVAEMGVPANHVWIFHGPSGGYKNDIDKAAPNSWRNLLSPFEITRHSFETGDPAVLLQVFVNVPASNTRLKRFDQDKQVDVMSLDGSASVGHFEMERWRQIMELRRPDGAAGAPGAPSAGLEGKAFSPLTLDTVAVIPGTGLVIEGQILPSLPVIGDADIRYRVSGTELTLSKTFTVSEINLPPPISIDSCNLTVSAGTGGFGADGRIDFSVERLGQGHLAGSIGTTGGLALEGAFDFDSELFDRARIEMWYRDNELGAAGEIAIEQPDRVRGIRSATVNARYEHGAFAAHGVVQPSLPAIRQGNLDLSYSEAEGLSIGGNLQLAEMPGIRSGSVDVTVNKRDDVWHVAATGTAQPAIPGIDSELTVNYEDGAFSAAFSGAFSRGMLSGNVSVGVTNRSLGDDGQPTGEPVPGAPLIVYGEGSATLQIAPWLQGTAGVRFAPDGEVTVAGEIGLPGQIEIFPRQQIDRDIFGIDIPIPIVPGIFAEVGGGLSAHAGIGPGVIDELRLGIEYNPAHEENTHVTGDGHVNVPADAGLRLAVHGGIGLGIPAASVSGGLEVGGELGIAGAAEAGVHVDWMPSQGLQIDAFGRLSAQPKFVFDVSGYVEVEALFFTIYENRWQLAEFEYGSDMTFGVNFPIRYREGEPFDISLDDVEFQVPEVSPTDILGGLIERVI